ncbi:hypothetical protein BH11ACT4_BH11ACT4_08130 [soil metagenome]
MPSYSDELDRLTSTYTAALSDPSAAEIDRAHAIVADRDVFFVGSGGTLPIAELAADLHQRLTGHLAHAITPLSVVEMIAAAPHAVVVIFSARAKHPDTEFAAAHALSRGNPLLLVTQKRRDELTGSLSAEQVTVLTVGGHGGDGFLATNSVLAMATAIARLYEPAKLPMVLAPTHYDADNLRQRILVLHGRLGRPAARDIETRFHELGLADVQLADYRNLAHGRHVGLHRRAATTTVIALIDPDVAPLARRTIDVLPHEIDVRTVATQSFGASGALELLAAVMRLPLKAAMEQLVEPSRPRVPKFGRDLYHLPFKRMYPVIANGPAERKAIACGLAPTFGEMSQFRAAYSSWVDMANRTTIGAIVLDYDGTCVATADRYDLPSEAVQKALIGCLQLGLPLVFATGRGDSLYRDLREWLPKSLWPLVTLGLHNGTWLQELDDALLIMEEPNLSLDRAEQALQFLVEIDAISLKRSGHQLSIRPIGGIGVERLRAIVATAISPDSDLIVATSGHSVDVIGRLLGKASVVHSTQYRFGEVLAIGDQGGEGGNDFEMLNAVPLSVSVDVCSTSLTRGWNTTNAAITGPDALVALLGTIAHGPRGPRLKLKRPLAEIDG